MRHDRNLRSACLARSPLLLVLIAIPVLCSAGCSTYRLVGERGRYMNEEIPQTVSDASIISGRGLGLGSETIGEFTVVLTENVEGNQKSVWADQKVAHVEEMKLLAADEAADRGATHIRVNDLSTMHTVMTSYDRTPRFFSNRWQESAKKRNQRSVTKFYPRIRVVLYRQDDPGEEENE